MRASRFNTAQPGARAEGTPRRPDTRECPKCKQERLSRRVPMESEIGSWSGELLWRCDIHGVFYERDL